MKTVVIVILAVLLAGSVAGNILEYKRYSSSRTIVLIGDKRITVKEYEDQLDYKDGKTVLSKLAYRDLIGWSAEKAGVVPVAKDVDDRIAQMERRAPALLSAAKADPSKMEELRQDLSTDIAFENLRIKDIKATDAEVAAFYDKHKSALSLPAQVKSTIAVASNAVDAATVAELLQQGMSPDLIARRPRVKVVGVGGFALPAQLPAELSARLNQTVYKMQVGQITTVPAGKAFLILKITDRKPQEVPTLASIKPTVERLVKLQKASSAGDALARLYHDANVTFEIDKYASYLGEIADRASKLDKVSPDASTSKAGPIDHSRPN